MSFVYFAHSDATNLVKVGRSGHPEGRIQALRSQLRDPSIRLLGVISGSGDYDGYWIEPVIHYALRDKRVSGEWFSISPSDVPALMLRFGGRWNQRRFFTDPDSVALHERRYGKPLSRRTRAA